MLRVKELDKTFARGRHRVLDGVSIEVAPRETVALVGVSGSGKSTLARCVVGLETPDGGAVEADGNDLLRRRPGSATRRAVQMIWQDPATALSPYLTALEAVQEALTVRHGRRDDGEEALETLIRVGLGERQASLYPHQLSGGQCQRVVIARALALEPRYLICDEPLTSLDLVAQAKILDLFSDLAQRTAVGILFISHDLAAVAGFADRVVVIDGGRIVEQGSVADVFRRPAHAVTRELVAVATGEQAGRRATALR